MTMRTGRVLMDAKAQGWTPGLPEFREPVLEYEPRRVRFLVVDRDDGQVYLDETHECQNGKAEAHRTGLIMREFKHPGSPRVRLIREVLPGRSRPTWRKPYNHAEVASLAATSEFLDIEAALEADNRLHPDQAGLVRREPKSIHAKPGGRIGSITKRKGKPRIREDGMKVARSAVYRPGRDYRVGPGSHFGGRRIDDFLK